MSPRKSSAHRKAEILATTLDLAFEVGPDHVTTGLIAGRIGLTQPAIYKYFPMKKNIWQAATEMLSHRIRENIQQGTQTGQPPVRKLRNLVQGHLQLVTEIPALPEIMVSRDPTGVLSETRRQIQADMKDFRVALTQVFESAKAKGCLSAELPTEDGVMLLLGIIQSLVLRLIVTRDPAPLVQDGERLLDLQLALFAEPGNNP